MSPAQAARLFGALADKTRLRLLLCLADEEGLSVTALAETLGLSQPGLSHQLRRLRLAGILTSRREGQSVFYALALGPARDLVRDHVRP
jgi:DNA-binding transcriptional ArsR family regulator